MVRGRKQNVAAFLRVEVIKVKNYKEAGGLAGAFVGCILTGICVYFTGSIWSAVITYVCLLLGGWIGKSIEKAEK